VLLAGLTPRQMSCREADGHADPFYRGMLAALALKSQSGTPRGPCDQSDQVSQNLQAVSMSPAASVPRLPFLSVRVLLFAGGRMCGAKGIGLNRRGRAVPHCAKWGQT